MRQTARIRRIRAWIALFILGLVLSGITAFPLQSELDWLVTLLQTDSLRTICISTGLFHWIDQVAKAIGETNERYPFLAYGTDWLAFAHLVIAVAFIGPYRDPIRNKWVITFGLIACLGVIPLAPIARYVRHIPFGWRAIDCSFGILGAIPLLLCRRLITEVETMVEAEVAVH